MKNNLFFVWEIYPKPSKKNYTTNKTDQFFVDNTWRIDWID